MSSRAKTGLLLVNLGSPHAPTSSEVARYLREFLSDERVIDLPTWQRWPLVNLFIVPFRAPKSAHAYRKVWTSEGSPLVVHGRALQQAVAERLPEWNVALAMRYGEPSIADGLAQLVAAGSDELIIFPLYPQYASSSTGSVLDAVYRALHGRWNAPNISVVPPFFDHPAFIHAWAEVARDPLAHVRADHVLFSFHGLPQRHLRKSAEANSPCLSHPQCCAAVTANNRHCYRAQCMATARELASALTLEPNRWSVSFQSRLGRTPWILPETTQTLSELLKAGNRRIAVLCPSFVADCLETLEEIGMRARTDFLAAGGEACELIFSLNTHPKWVAAVVEMARACQVTRPREVPVPTGHRIAAAAAPTS